MDPSKGTLTKEDIRRRLELCKKVLEERLEEMQDMRDAIYAAALDGKQWLVMILTKSLQAEEKAMGSRLEQMEQLEAALVTASDEPGETSKLRGRMMGHLEDQEGMPRAAGGEPHDALDQPRPGQRDREVIWGQ